MISLTWMSILILRYCSIFFLCTCYFFAIAISCYDRKGIRYAKKSQSSTSKVLPWETCGAFGVVPVVLRNGTWSFVVVAAAASVARRHTQEVSWRASLKLICRCFQQSVAVIQSAASRFLDNSRHRWGNYKVSSTSCTDNFAALSTLLLIQTE